MSAGRRAVAVARRAAGWLLRWAGEIVLTVVCGIALTTQSVETARGVAGWDDPAVGLPDHPAAHAARAAAVVGIVVLLWVRRWRPLAVAVTGLCLVLGYSLLTPSRGWDDLPVDGPAPDSGSYYVTVGPEGNGVPLVALVCVLWSALVYVPWRVSWAVLATAVALTAVPHVAGIPLAWEPQWISHLVAASLPVIVGGLALLVRQRRSAAVQLAAQAGELERRREADARAAVAEERIRISSELHDVVAHHVTLMTVQIAAADALLDSDRVRAREAIGSARETGHVALAEMRDLVGALRADPDREPTRGLDAVPALVAGLRGAGLQVRTWETGTPRPLSTAVDLAAYRVVQEALTNAVRHSGSGTADLSLHWGGDELLLRVADRGVGRQDGAASSVGGQGLVGMGERVAAFGGRLESRNRPEGGFEVIAWLPYVRPGASDGTGPPHDPGPSHDPSHDAGTSRGTDRAAGVPAEVA